MVATLIGSVHMLPDGLDWVTPELESAVAQCGVLVTEIGSSASDGAQSNWLTLAQGEPTPALSDRLNAKELAQLSTIDLPIPTEQRNQTESWALALLAMQAQTPALGLKTENGVEAVLTEMAIAQNKPLLGLETAIDQFARFDALPADAQDALLSDALSTPAAQRAEFQAMLTAWLSGDLAALMEVTQSDTMANANVRESLILAPNHKWATKMDTLIAINERPCFAIGTAHLLGQGSIPAFLTQRGYTITRVQ